MANVLNVSSFGGGVVLEGSADAQRTDEVRAADSYEIGPRGQLVAASDLSTTGLSMLTDSGGSPLTKIHGLHSILRSVAPQVLAVGDNGVGEYTVRLIDPAAGTSSAIGIIGVTIAFMQYGANVTVATMAEPNGVSTTVLNIGPRAFRYPKEGLGLYYVITNSSGTSFVQSDGYDALGTGPLGEFGGGNKSKQLYFRGIAAHGSFIFGYGFDASDATNGDGPNRVMFCNIGQPKKWGNDPEDPGPYSNHSFVDTDAIVIGGAGSIIRAMLSWAGRAYVGAADGLHFIEGYGRESFLTNGPVPLRNSLSTIGPHALIEGPDGLLYGVDARAGLWIFNGGDTDPVGLRLRDFHGHSNGYWDLIWTDASRSALYPGQSNQDLVWLWSDTETKEVWIVIPWCDATAGYGYGTDTVVIKYSTRTGGFTRQKFIGKILSAGSIFAQESVAPRSKFIAQPGSTPNLARYAYKATPASSPIMPSVLPTASLGEYAPHGPDGVGISRRLYLTLSWESAASLPLVFALTPKVDQSPTGTGFSLTIGPTAPSAPSDGDYWYDTSGTDTNLGNGTAGAFTPAHPGDYLLKRWKASFAKWMYTYDGGEQGTRASIPLAFTPARGTRVMHDIVCTSAAGRYQIEGLGLEPATIRADK